MTISRQKEARSWDYALLLLSEFRDSLFSVPVTDGTSNVWRQNEQIIILIQRVNG